MTVSTVGERRVIEIVVDSNRAARELKQINTSLDTLNKTARQSLFVFKTLGAAIGLATLSNLVREVGSAVNAYKELEGRLNIVSRSMGSVASVQKELLEVANKTYASFDATGKLYARLSIATKELGTSHDDLLKVISTVSNTLRISGASAQETAATMVQLSQALGSGRLQGDELRSMLENNIRLAQVFADALGVPIGALKQLGSEGKLTTDILTEAMIEASSVVASEAEKYPVSLGRAWTVFTNNLSVAIAEMDKAYGITEKLSFALATLGKSLEFVINNIQSLLIIGAIGAAMYKFGIFTLSASKALIGFNVAAMTLIGNLRVLTAVLLTPWVGIPLAIGAAIAFVYSLTKAMSDYQIETQRAGESTAAFNERLNSYKENGDKYRAQLVDKEIEQYQRMIEVLTNSMTLMLEDANHSQAAVAAIAKQIDGYNTRVDILNAKKDKLLGATREVNDALSDEAERMEKAAKAAAEYIPSLVRKIAQQQFELSLIGKSKEAQAQLRAEREKSLMVDQGVAKLGEEYRDTLEALATRYSNLKKAQISRNKALEDEVRWNEEQGKALKEISDEFEILDRNYDSAEKSINGYIALLRVEFQSITLSDRERFIQNALLKEEDNLRTLTNEKRETSIKQIKELAATIYDSAKAQEAAQDALEEYQGIWDQFGSNLDQGWTQLWQDMFNGSAKAFDNFADTLVDSFKNLLAELIALTIKNQIIIPIYTQMMNGMTGGGSAGSSIPGIGNMLGSGNIGSGLNTFLGNYGIGNSSFVGPLQPGVSAPSNLFGGTNLGYGLSGIGGGLIGGAIGGQPGGIGGSIGGAIGYGLATGTGTIGTALGGLGSIGPLALAGPVGMLIGSVLGGVLGGLLEDTPDPRYFASGPLGNVRLSGSQDMDQGQLQQAEQYLSVGNTYEKAFLGLLDQSALAALEDFTPPDYSQVHIESEHELAAYVILRIRKALEHLGNNELSLSLAETLHPNMPVGTLTMEDAQWVIQQVAVETGALTTAIQAMIAPTSQLSMVSDSVSAKFEELGIKVLPDSFEGLQNLVNEIDTTTDSGKALYIALLELFPEFVQLMELEQQREQVIISLQGAIDISNGKMTDWGVALQSINATYGTSITTLSDVNSTIEFWSGNLEKADEKTLGLVSALLQLGSAIQGVTSLSIGIDQFVNGTTAWNATLKSVNDQFGLSFENISDVREYLKPFVDPNVLGKLDPAHRAEVDAVYGLSQKWSPETKKAAKSSTNNLVEQIANAWDKLNEMVASFDRSIRDMGLTDFEKSIVHVYDALADNESKIRELASETGNMANGELALMRARELATMQIEQLTTKEQQRIVSYNQSIYDQINGFGLTGASSEAYNLGIWYRNEVTKAKENGGDITAINKLFDLKKGTLGQTASGVAGASSNSVSNAQKINWGSIADSLREAAMNLSTAGLTIIPLGNALNNQFRNAVQRAWGGDSEAFEQASSLASEFLDAERNRALTGVDYRRTVGQTVAELESLANLADSKDTPIQQVAAYSKATATSVSVSTTQLDKLIALGMGSSATDEQYGNILSGLTETTNDHLLVLIDQIRSDNSEIRAMFVEMVANSQKQARTLEEWDDIGMPQTQTA